MDALCSPVDNGIKWRALPADFPPWSTVHNCFAAWEPLELGEAGGCRQRL
jgi:transposase